MSKQPLALPHQLILHPSVSNTIKVSSTTVGRDKAYRAIQFAARFLAWYCLRKNYTKETVARWDALKATLALSRKLMRIGKPLEHLQASIRSFDIQDNVIKFTAASRQLCYALYLIYDMFVWANATKVFTLAPETALKVNRRANTFWFSGIAISIVSGLYKLRGLQLRNRTVKASAEKVPETQPVVVQGNQAYAIKYQLVQDMLDIVIPGTAIGYFALDEGVLGIAGFITSIMGLRSHSAEVLAKK